MHIKRSGWYSELLAVTAGWDSEQARVLRLAAPMHDLGKIGIPDAILRKPGKLTPEETSVMQSHTLLGAKLLDRAASPMCGWRGYRSLPPRTMGRPRVSTRAVGARDTRVCPHRGHRRRVRRTDARSRLPPRTARGESRPNNHKRTWQPVQPRIVDVFLSLLPEMRQSPLL